MPLSVARPTMTDPTRLTDSVGVIGIDATDYGDYEEQHTSIRVELLQQALELVDTLGWDKVDVATVESSDGDGLPMLVIRPPQGALFDNSDQAGIAVCPVTEQGRDTDE